MALEELSRANQNDPFIQCMLAQTYEKLGDKGKAAEYYHKALAATFHNPPRGRELYRVQYPAPGDPALALRVQKLLAPVPVRLDDRWGLDHGTWAVLCHVYPQAGIPVVQLSIDEPQPASFHHEIGKRIAPLREEGILIVGSGNLVHNPTHTHGAGTQPSRTTGPSRSRSGCVS